MISAWERFFCLAVKPNISINKSRFYTISMCNLLRVISCRISRKGSPKILLYSIATFLSSFNSTRLRILNVLLQKKVFPSFLWFLVKLILRYHMAQERFTIIIFAWKICQIWLEKFFKSILRIKQQFISVLISSKNNISIGSLKKIENYFWCPIGDLFC